MSMAGKDTTFDVVTNQAVFGRRTIQADQQNTLPVHLAC